MKLDSSVVRLSLGAGLRFVGGASGLKCKRGLDSRERRRITDYKRGLDMRRARRRDADSKLEVNAPAWFGVSLSRWLPTRCRLWNPGTMQVGC